ncbi:MAG TPA: ATP-binding protein [Gemmatimonadaceae bacterium]|nr:ATP-binding protein [Gemmatimonadaceae bacterium]
MRLSAVEGHVNEENRPLSFQRTLLVLIGLAVLAGTVPAGLVLDRWLAGALEARARADLAASPRMLADRNAAIGVAMVMEAEAIASNPDLSRALMSGDRNAAREVLATSQATAGEGALLVGRDGSAWAGMSPTVTLVDSTRRGMNALAVVADGRSLHAVALAPVVVRGTWAGAAGVSRPFDRDMAETLAGLTRSDVVLVAPGGVVAGATMGDTLADALALRAARADSVSEVRIGSGRFLVAAAPLAPGAKVLFVRDLGRELALVPRLRRVLAASGALALAVTLLLGAVLAGRVTAPVRTLADAADRLADGDFDATVTPSGALEVRRLALAFDEMRRALAARLGEVQSANVALADRSEKLSMLQAQLMQRDRLAATGHLVVQLAHEIRNPVANVRNCLEVIRRRSGDDNDTRQFADLAIEELMRMHTLAENLLDLNRPRDAAGAVCEPVAVVREVEALLKLDGLAAVDVRADTPAVKATIGPDALKQVLLNLARNASEATTGHATLTITVGAVRDVVRIDVADDGPGIPDNLLPRIFDPFFTTKTAVHGVGLGLFVAEGLVRSVGGRLTARNRAPEPGALFRIEIPAAA